LAVVSREGFFRVQRITEKEASQLNSPNIEFHEEENFKAIHTHTQKIPNKPHNVEGSKDLVSKATQSREKGKGKCKQKWKLRGSLDVHYLRDIYAT
jgi:hypothetical protein